MYSWSNFLSSSNLDVCEGWGCGLSSRSLEADMAITVCKCKKSARAQIQCRIVGLFVARKWFVGTSGLKEFLGKLERFFSKKLHEQTSGYF